MAGDQARGLIASDEQSPFRLRNGGKDSCFAMARRIAKWKDTMLTVEEFLAYSIHLETEAATRFGELADAMESGGNKEVAQLFRRLSNYSRMHLADAKARSGFRDIPELGPQDYVWPDLESPESAAIWGADPMLGRGEALQIALAAETAGHDFYKSVLDTTDDPDIKRFAAEFTDEEAGHVAELKKWIAAHEAGRQAPVD
jgi:rubrerythrin